MLIINDILYNIFSQVDFYCKEGLWVITFKWIIKHHQWFKIKASWISDQQRPVASPPKMLFLPLNVFTFEEMAYLIWKFDSFLIDSRLKWQVF